MNDQRSFERLFADRMDAERGSARLPDAFYVEFHDQASHVRQRPRWLALIKEPPMRISSHVAVGSPMVRVAAIMVATLLLALTLAGAGIAGSRLLAADGGIVVDQGGAGDFTTINEAVDMAEDGDTIRIRPGTYEESVVIRRKDITLIGDGPVEEVIISLDDGTPVLDISDSDADVSNLTLTGKHSNAKIRGGAPTLHDLVFDGLGHPYVGEVHRGPRDAELPASIDSIGCLIAQDALECAEYFSFRTALDLLVTQARIIDNTFIGGGELGANAGSRPHIEGNTLTGGPFIYAWGVGPATVIRDNTITAPSQLGISILADAPSDFLVEGNTISDTWTGIAAGGGVTITDNEFVGNDRAIALDQADGLIDGNRIRDGEIGIFTFEGESRAGAPTITGNDIEVWGWGIDLASGNGVVVSGNTVCGGEVSINVGADAGASVTDNEVCE